MRVQALSIISILVLTTALFSCRNSPQENRPTVTAIFPSGDTVPENLLRLYVHFSQPMRTTRIMEHIRLVDQQGLTIEGAFFPQLDGLWDPSQQQLTLLLDPGRVKTGLQTNEQMGRALPLGQTISLVIDSVQAVDGQVMPEAVRKTYWVLTADTVAPELDTWAITLPKAGSRKALWIDFLEPLDEFSLRQRLVLTDTENQPISGEVSIINLERTWQFIPTKNWQAGDYRLYVHRRLEDSAGNNLNGLFDHEVGGLKIKSEDQVDTLSIRISLD